MFNKFKYTLQEVSRDLVAMLYRLAYTLDLQVRPGAGAAMLKLKEGLHMHEWPPYDEFDLAGFDVASGLETVYRYAVYGELENRWISDDYEDGNLGRLTSLLEIVRGCHLIEHNGDDIANAHKQDAVRVGGLSEMVKLATARYHLDSALQISLSDIALLAGIDERSVRNSLYATGNSMLVAFRNDLGELVADKLEALRWLRSRPNFKETVRIGSWAKTPDRLSPEEIAPFLKARIHECFGIAGEQLSFDNAAQSIGWPVERVRQLVEGPVGNISPEDCPAIAQMVYLDTVWFTTQVMRALFPEAMKSIQPSTTHPDVEASPFNQEEYSLNVKLTDAGIRNGYFDIERRYAERLFPEDSFGSRGAERRGIPVNFFHDFKGSPYSSDMREKSASLISPRKRFSAYFSAHKAKAGDVIHIKRIGERDYQLIYQPKIKGEKHA
jgi:hypothetical protein